MSLQRVLTEEGSSLPTRCSVWAGSVCFELCRQGMILAPLLGCNHNTQYVPIFSSAARIPNRTRKHDLSHLLDDLNLSIKPRCSTFYQRYVRGQAHPIHMATGVQIIKSVEDNIKCSKPIDVELGIFNVGMIGFQL